MFSYLDKILLLLKKKKKKNLRKIFTLQVMITGL